MPSVMLFGGSIDCMLIPHDFWSSNWKVMQCKKKEIKEKQRKTREREIWWKKILFLFITESDTSPNIYNGNQICKEWN